jgi:hypothetical protein
MPRSQPIRSAITLTGISGNSRNNSRTLGSLGSKVCVGGVWGYASWFAIPGEVLAAKEGAVRGAGLSGWDCGRQGGRPPGERDHLRDAIRAVPKGSNPARGAVLVPVIAGWH